MSNCDGIEKLINNVVFSSAELCFVLHCCEDCEGDVDNDGDSAEDNRVGGGRNVDHELISVCGHGCMYVSLSVSVSVCLCVCLSLSLTHTHCQRESRKKENKNLK